MAGSASSRRASPTAAAVTACADAAALARSRRAACPSCAVVSLRRTPAALSSASAARRAPGHASAADVRLARTHLAIWPSSTTAPRAVWAPAAIALSASCCAPCQHPSADRRRTRTAAPLLSWSADAAPSWRTCLAGYRDPPGEARKKSSPPKAAARRVVSRNAIDSTRRTRSESLRLRCLSFSVPAALVAPHACQSCNDWEV